METQATSSSLKEKPANFWLLVAEALGLFVVLPLLFYWELVPLPKIVGLLLVTGYCGYRLWRDPSFGKGLLRRESPSDASKFILFRVIAAVIGIAGLVWVLQPEAFFSFPRERPVIWVLVVFLYPLLSALPQEVIYRTYFFHRFDEYIPLKNGTVILSALAFSFLHIVYDNWWALALSFVAGLLLGITYERTKSLFWVTIEHSIYGLIVFTLGLGNFFYEPF